MEGEEEVREGDTDASALLCAKQGDANDSITRGSVIGPYQLTGKATRKLFIRNVDGMTRSCIFSARFVCAPLPPCCLNNRMPLFSK